MRTAILACALAVACGGDSTTKPDAPPGTEIDASANQPDAFEGPLPDADLSIPDAFTSADAPVGECDPVGGEPALALDVVGDGFDTPVGMASPPGDPRLFVVEQYGTIRFVEGGGPAEPPFLDIDPLIDGGDEQGLLGLAFHPDYASNGRFFIYYTQPDGDIQIDEFHVSANPDIADFDSRKPILSIEHSEFSNHNGGSILFGPDGNLYFGVGDGGSGGDPGENSENINAMLGKVHRIDVDGGDPYRAAPGNPFLGADGADTVFFYGVRNPWRFTFDRSTGDIYLADVGQNDWEEVDVLPPGSGGANLGWDHWEGNEEYECPGGGCSRVGRTFPIHVYPHGGEEKSITGGYVYRGCKMPGYRGRYFFADYYGEVSSLIWDGGDGATSVRRHASLDMGGISSFGQDLEGEIYMVGHWDGTINKIVPAP